MKSIKQKLTKERTKLVNKISKLEKFTKTDEYFKLSVTYQLAVIDQLNAMLHYAKALNDRIDMEDVKQSTKKVVKWKWITEAWGKQTLREQYLTEEQAKNVFSDYFRSKHKSCTKADWTRKEFEE